LWTRTADPAMTVAPRPWADGQSHRQVPDAAGDLGRGAARRRDLGGARRFAHRPENELVQVVHVSPAAGVDLTVSYDMTGKVCQAWDHLTAYRLK